MVWFLTPLAESVKLGSIKYLLQRYLGRFLQEKLTLEQLTVDVFKGTGTLSDVILDVKVLNQLGEEHNIPVEFVDGYISCISVSIPWANILKDSPFIEVSGLQLTVQPKECVVSNGNCTSIFESFSSVSSSTTSVAVEAAEEALRQNNDNEAQPLEMVEGIACTIDSILRRIKVKFVNTVIRVEHMPKDCNSGGAVEIHIKVVDYMDESSDDPIPENPCDGANRSFPIAAFITKVFFMEGVTLFTEEFSSNGKTRSVMSVSTESTSDSKNSDPAFASAPGSPVQSLTGSSMIGNPLLNCESAIMFAKILGRQELRMVVKQADEIVGPQVDLDLTLGSVLVFLSPRQFHLIHELLNALASFSSVDSSSLPAKTRCMEKPMSSADFQKLEEDMQRNIRPQSPLASKGLQGLQTWSTAHFDESDEEFLSMKERNSAMADSLASSAISMDASFSSTISGASVASRDTFSSRPSYSSSYSQLVMNRSKKKSGKSSSRHGLVDSDPSSVISKFHMNLGSFAVVLLHENKLIVSGDLGTLAPSSVYQMKLLSNAFFDNIGLYSLSSSAGTNAFQEAKEVFLKAVQLNHIRLLAAAVVLDGSEQRVGGGCVLSGCLTAARMELLECLVENKSAKQDSPVVYNELLIFHNETKEKVDNYSNKGKPNFKLKFSYPKTAVSGHSKRSHPSTEINIELDSCQCEVDVTIVERINALFIPSPLFTPAKLSNAKPSDFWSAQYFIQEITTQPTPETKIDLAIDSSFLVIKLRFPIPDLRPMSGVNKQLWWMRCVRDDYVLLELTDAAFRTKLDSSERSVAFEVFSKAILGHFQEGDADRPITFFRVDSEEKKSSSGHRTNSDCPRFVLKILPAPTCADLEHVWPNRVEESMHMSEADLFGDSSHKESSPFSSKRVIHESDTPHDKAQYPAAEAEELVIPGDREEMSTFEAQALQNSRLHIEMNLPNGSLIFPSKHFFELIYNRLSTDLLLWEPSTLSRRTKTVFAGDEPNSWGLNDNQTFSKCKSGTQYGNDFDSEEEDEEEENDDDEFNFESMKSDRYWSFHQKSRRVKKQKSAGVHAQNRVTVKINVGKGAVTFVTPARDSTGNAIPGQQGEFLIEVTEGSVFIVAGYNDTPKLTYICVQINNAAVFHEGLRQSPNNAMKLPVFGTHPSHLFRTLYRSDQGVLAVGSTTAVGCGSASSLDMVAVAIKIHMNDSSHHLKTIRVASAIRGATLRHRVVPSQHSWLKQIQDFFHVLDYPIHGYDPPTVITELHVHLWDCAIDYRPKYLPLQCILTLGSFSVSSNIAAQTKISTLRFLAEDVCLLLAERTAKTPPLLVDIMRYYVCVLEMGLFELSLRLCEKPSASNPRVDMRASVSTLHIRTCSDSTRALGDLLNYFAANADLTSVTPSNSECTDFDDNSSASGSTTTRDVPPSPSKSHGRRDDETLVQLDNWQESGLPRISASQMEQVHNMMAEAMQEASPDRAQTNTGTGTICLMEFLLTCNTKTVRDDLFLEMPAPGGSKNRSCCRVMSNRFRVTILPTKSYRDSEDVAVFYFPDESQKVAPTLKESDDVDENIFGENETVGFVPDMSLDDFDDDLDEGFCILDEEAGTGIINPSGLPEIRTLTPEPIQVMDNHFAVPLEKTDILNPPSDYPCPVARYRLCQMNIIWHMYGGKDFGPPPKPHPNKGVRVDDSSVTKNRQSMGFGETQSISFSKSRPQEVRFGSPKSPDSPQQPSKQDRPGSFWQVKGGPGRDSEMLMELQLNKVRFCHELYPDHTEEASRQVLVIKDFEVRDRLASSDINKFLYLYSSQDRPRQAHANMIVVKALHVRPDPRLPAQECCLRVSLLPLRLNIEQDTFFFLHTYFTEVYGASEDDDKDQTSRHNTPTMHHPPVMTVNLTDNSTESSSRSDRTSPLLIQLEEAHFDIEDPGSTCRTQRSSTESSPSTADGTEDGSAPIFFRRFVFSPDVFVCLDYDGKHVDMTHGSFAGLLMGLTSLSNTEVKLKRLEHRNGLLGFDKLCSYAAKEWMTDIRTNQIHNIIGGVGPMNALFKMFQGIRDLVCMPLEQYQKDGRIVRGLQRGANSFTTSTALAALDITSRIVQYIQCTAETAYDVLSPGPSVRHAVSSKGDSKRRRKRHNQSSDIREGMTNAYNVVRDGIGETAQNLVRVASEEHEQKGVKGAVGGLLREIAPAVVKPVIAISEATTHVLDGMRGQLVPDAHRAAVEKYRTE